LYAEYVFVYTPFMQTQRAYYDAPLSSLASPYHAEILEVRPYKSGEAELLAVILDKTIFYPEGGGQSADRGSINGIPLGDVREENGEILHIAGAKTALRPGPAELVLDTKRRRDYTVQHSAQHLLSGTILKLSGFPTVSMHLGETYNTIDVNAPELPQEILTAVEDAVADAIEENHPVVIHLCPPEKVEDFPLRKIPPKGEEVIRVVEIEGNDFSPCCGTHVTATGQIGMLRILGAEKYKGMTRVTFIAGRRCLRESRLLGENAGLISRALKVPVEETGKAALSVLEKANKLERDLKAYEEESARIKAEALIAEAGLAGTGSVAETETIFVKSFPDTGMEELLRIGKQAQKLTPAILVLASGREAKFAALGGKPGADLRPRLKEALEKAGGKGGGGPSFFQGQFNTAEELAAFIASLK
jgi:alanyl-tRNA synthetase